MSFDFKFDDYFDNSDESSSSSSSSKVSSIVRTISLICAMAVPITYAIVNTIDKVIVSGRVNHTNSYVIFAGIVDACIGIVIGLFGDWRISVLKALSWKDFVYPLLSGVSLGLSTVMYFFAMEWADPSKVVGIMAIYPLFVILWSLIFLDDSIKPLACVGIAITIFGGFLLSIEGLKKFYRYILGKIPSCAERRDIFDENEEAKKRLAAEADMEKRVNKGYGECWYPTKNRKKENPSQEKNSVLGSGGDVTDDVTSDANRPLLGGGETIVTVYDSTSSSDDNLDQSMKTAPFLPEGSDIDKDSKLNSANSGSGKIGFKKIVLGLLPMPILMSGNDFFAKISVGDINTNNVSALNSLGLGFVLACMALSKEARHHFIDEVKYNWLHCIIVESLTVLANYLLIRAMVGLPAYIVSSLSASRPLFILVLETVLGISRDSAKHCFGFKLFPIICTVSGVILMTIFS